MGDRNNKPVAEWVAVPFRFKPVERTQSRRTDDSLPRMAFALVRMGGRVTMHFPYALRFFVIHGRSVILLMLIHVQWASAQVSPRLLGLERVYFKQISDSELVEHPKIMAHLPPVLAGLRSESIHADPCGSCEYETIHNIQLPVAGREKKYGFARLSIMSTPESLTHGGLSTSMKNEHVCGCSMQGGLLAIRKPSQTTKSTAPSRPRTTWSLFGFRGACFARGAHGG